MGGGGGGKEVSSTLCGRWDGRKKELEVKILLRRGRGRGWWQNISRKGALRLDKPVSIELLAISSIRTFDDWVLRGRVMVVALW